MAWGSPLARGLADSFRVLEPLQRGSGDERLTVVRHVADLHEVLESPPGDYQIAVALYAWPGLERGPDGGKHSTP